MDKDTFVNMLKATEAYTKNTKEIDFILDQTLHEIFTETEPYDHLAYPDDNGMSSYYSSNVKKADAELIDRFCQENKILPLNTRLVKTGENEYDLRVASADHDSKATYFKSYDFEGKKVNVVS